MIVTLWRFARAWPGALFFTIENEEAESFKNDRHSAIVCSVMAGGAKLSTRENEGRKREGFKKLSQRDPN